MDRFRGLPSSVSCRSLGRAGVLGTHPSSLLPGGISAQSRKKSSGTVWAHGVLSMLNCVLPASCCWGYSRSSILKAYYQSRLLQEPSRHPKPGHPLSPMGNTQNSCLDHSLVSLYSLCITQKVSCIRAETMPCIHLNSKIKL